MKAKLRLLLLCVLVVIAGLGVASAVQISLDSPATFPSDI